MVDPQEPDNSLITLENDPIYYEGITPEELTETLITSSQPKVFDCFFSNLHLHFIDPMFLRYDEPQFQIDLQETKEEAEKKYLKDYISAEEALTKFSTEEKNQEQILLLSHIYIAMRKKGYPRYDEEKPCLVR